MTKEELLALMDLKETTNKPAKKIEAGDSGRQKPKITTDSVIVLDEWDRMKGEELSNNLRYLFNFDNSKPLEDLDWADLHASLFLREPEQTKTCKDKIREAFISKLMETSQYLQLHQSTMSNSFASEEAIKPLAMELQKYRQENTPPPKQPRKKCNHPEEGSDEEGTGRITPGKEGELVARVAEAVNKAIEATDQIEEALAALGCGEGEHTNSKLSTAKIAEIFKRVKGSSVVSKIMKQAGKWRRIAQSRQRHKYQPNPVEMTGTLLTNKLSLMLPIELAKLVDDDYELDSMRKLMESQSLGRELKDREPLGKGPIVVTVDTSGSMRGPKVEAAKAFALSMVYIARKQKRWITLVDYAGGTQGYYLTIKPQERKEMKLLLWLEHFFSGGTILDVPLVELPNKWKEIGAPKGKTDLIIITDGIVRLDPVVEVSFNKWKKEEKVKCVSLILANRVGDMAKVSEETYLLNSMSLEEDGVLNCLSI